MNAALRAKAMLVDPLAEWVHVASEPGDAVRLLRGYVGLLALIPAVCGFIGGCLIGVVVPGVGTVRAPVLAGLLGAIFGYLATFVKVLLVSAVIELLAPAFGGRRNLPGALKLAVYSFTPLWLVGIFLVLPGLRFLELAGLYGAYLLAAGLPPLMQAPEEKAHAYAAAIVVFAGLLTLVAAEAQRALFGTPAV